MKKSSLIFYLLITLICVGFFSFFGEGLPRFWYDDISHYKIAGETPYIKLFFQILDFTHKDVRLLVTNHLLSKFYLDFFGENLYLYRLTKMLIISFGICMIASLLIREGVRKAVMLPAFMVYMSSPILLIGTVWIVVLGTWALFFKAFAFFIFFQIYRSGRRDIKFYLLSISILAVMMFGVKAREEFTLAPFIILTFLLFKRSKSLSLYLIAIAAIIIVFPYYAISWGGGGAVSHFHPSNLKMFNMYFKEVYIFIPFLLYSVYLHTTKKDIRLSDITIFSLIWVLFEAGMVFIYPSDEMRYLESLLLASTFFFVSFIEAGIEKMPRQSYAAVLLIFLLLTGYKVYENVRWDYSFRGSLGSFFTAVDKQMKYINGRYENSLCLYEDFTLLYYDWKTTNHYVNVNPNNSWGRKFEEFYSVSIGKDGRVGVKLINPERYEHIISLDNTLSFRDPGVSNLIIFEGAGNTLFDRIQRRFNFKIYSAGLYNTKLGNVVNYPVQRAISIVR